MYGDTIAKRALDAFLDDAINAMQLSPTEDAQRRASAVPNPVAEMRKEARANIQANMKSLYGTNRADYADVVDLVFYHNRAKLSFDRYEKAKKALADYDSDRQLREEARKEAQRTVRKHALAAAVVGTALARNALGDGAPHVRLLLGPDRDVLENEEEVELNTALNAMRNALDADAAPTALRLGELCAIVQSVLG